MKHTYLLVFCFSIFLSYGCLEEHNNLVPKISTVPAGGIRNVDLTSVSGNKAMIEITFFAVDHFGAFMTGIGADDLRADNLSNVTIDILNLSLEKEQDKGPYSATLLFDQSGSIRGTDPRDARILAGRRFTTLLDNGDEASVVAFTDGGRYQSPSEILSDFSSSPRLLLPAIESLAGRTGGGTPLYLALSQMIDYTHQQGRNTNKVIVAFTDGQDTRGGVTINQLIQSASNKNVRLYTVGLGTSVNFGDLSKLAFETGGAVMLAEDAAQLITLYSSLGQLLQGQAELYKVQLEMINASGNWRTGQIVSGTLVLQLSESLEIKYPFRKIII